MTDEPGPRMPPDWRPPQRVLLEQRWADHRQHDRLVELARERSPRRGEPAWVLEQEPERYSRDLTVV